MPRNLSSADEFGMLSLSDAAESVLKQLSDNYPLATDLKPAGPTNNLEDRVFIEAVRELSDTGLLQYEACMLGVFPHPYYSEAVLTHRGFDLARRQKKNDGLATSESQERSAFDYLSNNLCQQA